MYHGIPGTAQTANNLSAVLLRNDLANLDFMVLPNDGWLYERGIGIRGP